MSAIPDIDDLGVPAHSEEPPKKKRQKLGRSEITMNLVAMLDLSFNILIFFIITANFAVHEGVITAKVPSIDGSLLNEKPLDLPKTPLKVMLSATSGEGQARITIDGSSEQTQDFDRLSEVLGRIQKNKENPAGAFDPDNPVIINPDKNTRWQDVVNAFNAVVKAKYSDVSFGPINGGGEQGSSGG